MLEISPWSLGSPTRSLHYALKYQNPTQIFAPLQNPQKTASPNPSSLSKIAF